MSNIFRLALAALLAASLPAAAAEGETDGKVCFLGRCIGDKLEDLRGEVITTDSGCDNENYFGIRSCKINEVRMNFLSSQKPLFLKRLNPTHVEYTFYQGEIVGFNLNAHKDNFEILLQMSIGKWGEPNSNTRSNATWKLSGGELMVSRDGPQSTLSFFTTAAGEAVVKKMRRDGAEFF